MRRLWTKFGVLLAATLLGAALLGVPASTARHPRGRADALREQARALLARTSGEMKVAGLKQPVEIVRDTWGVPHIYAKTQEDLFFAQGFVVAQDRLWQLDLWRRQAEGRLAEVLGPEAVERDRYALLLRYRGDWNAEWKSYSPDTKSIVESFVRGINAYIVMLDENLPIEFQLLGTRPGLWRPEVCVSRMAAFPMTGNASRELLRAILVERLGAERAAQLFPTEPLRVPRPAPGFSLDGMDAAVLAGLEQAAGPVRFDRMEGSNNWAISGAKTRSGKPILANDPHRALLLPSLRYLVHLVAPGWDVVGAGEPALPGVSIGHNQRIAFGLTIFEGDQQDIVVERMSHDATMYFDPHAPSNWRKIDVVEEEIPVRGESWPRRVQLKFTRHGPVIYEDRGRQRAYVLRWVGSEPGTAGYLAGLAISRAQNWHEFRHALERWKLPPENFVYADVEGNIGYQAAALVPVRANDGLLPVPGDTDQFEWRSFLKLDDLPHEYNPTRGFVATANNNTLPSNEKRLIGFDWAPPERVERIREVLAEAQGASVEDSERLQADVSSLSARELKLLLDQVPLVGAKRAAALQLLRSWDARMDADSGTAAIFAVWLEKLREDVYRPLVPAELLPLARRMGSAHTVVRVLREADPAFFPGGDATGQRNRILGSALDEALAELEQRFGADLNSWRWGALHTASFTHALAQNSDRSAVFNRGPVERSGDGGTVNATSGAAFRQTHGASFREVLDLSNWDDSAAINVPGQSGQPESPNYDDLLSLWSHEKYFPLAYSRAAVEKHARARLRLVP